jgi:hypothetical protein
MTHLSQGRIEVTTVAPAPIVIHGRVLARFSDYDGLHRAIAAHAAELQLTRGEIDHLSGNRDGYTAKVLAPTHYRKLGPVSLGNTVGALGCYLLLIEDETETKKLLSSPPGPRPKASGTIMAAVSPTSARSSAQSAVPWR